jgi:hypothetical protein
MVAALHLNYPRLLPGNRSRSTMRRRLQAILIHPRELQLPQRRTRPITILSTLQPLVESQIKTIPSDLI